MDANILRTIELIFNLLCVCRRIRSGAPRALRQAMQQRGLVYGRLEDLPRLSFWVRLCQSACLLDESSPPRPTLLVSDWLGSPPYEQLQSLLYAWMDMSNITMGRSQRAATYERLIRDQPLGKADERNLATLKAMGLIKSDAGRSSGWRWAPDNLQEAWLPPFKPWLVDYESLVTPYPPDWKALWQLEAFLEPKEPGIYWLISVMLRKAAQHGVNNAQTPNLEAVLRKGLGGDIPPILLEQIRAQPKTRVMPGVMLEFSDPNELHALRKSPAFRRDGCSMLSAHHMHVSQLQSEKILRQLCKRGYLCQDDLSRVDAGDSVRVGGRTAPTLRLSQVDRAYLLSVILVMDELRINIISPPGLAARLSLGLSPAMKAAAANQALVEIKALEKTEPWQPDDELPPPPDTELMIALEHAIHQSEAIDILYQAPGQATGEHRHLTPLLIEQRGLRFYLIAYCHKRRANRTFRIDRMNLLAHPPQP